MTRILSRRHFLATAAAAVVLPKFLPAAMPNDDIPIIDTHVHLFDGNRPQGAPYKGSKKHVGGVALPSMYAGIARPLGIVGAVQIDASSWLEDNLWVLDTIQPTPFFVGHVGNLQPDKPDFGAYLERFAKNPLFRGIRYGNVWGYDLVKQADNPVFIDGLKLLAKANLVLDTANPRIDLLRAVIKVSDAVPDLRIVIDHLPGFDPSPEDQADYNDILRILAPRKQIFVKLSSIVHAVRPSGTITPGLAAHRDRLDLLAGTFGEDRVLFGSDWPNAVGVSELPDTVALVREYYSTKSRAAAEKFFWRNSITAYRWAKRDASQPG
jgi:L-fuconolactonase